ncbi:MAG: xylulokinase [Candidatus Nanopelagicales bacterium]
MKKRLVAGVDSSTQSVKVVVRDAETGELVREARGSHPDGTEIDPQIWWEELTKSLSGLLDDVEAIGIGAQQHGMVVVDEDKNVVRPALLWNDTRSAKAAEDLIQDLGGRENWAKATGSVPLAAFTVTKLRWFAENEPALAKKVTGVMLPHDYLTWKLAGAKANPTTDRGDASGTGYFSASENKYKNEILKLAFSRDLSVPDIAEPNAIVGETKEGIKLAAGTGDNMAAALGLGAESGDVVVSLGTSGTAYAVSDNPSFDESGIVAGFADATGKYLPLACTLNAARILSAAAKVLKVDLDEFSKLALASKPGAGGLVLLPYLDGERTPNLPNATGSLFGMTRENMTAENFARAAVEGMLCGLADAVNALVELGVNPKKVSLIGGAAANPAVQKIATTLFKVPVAIPPVAEYVADGAARQAAWALSKEAALPNWKVSDTVLLEPDYRPEVLEAYSTSFKALHG